MTPDPIDDKSTFSDTAVLCEQKDLTTELLCVKDISRYFSLRFISNGYPAHMTQW